MCWDESILAYFFWDPSRGVFPWTLPLLGRPILWYGVWFTLGLFLAYLAAYRLLKHEKLALFSERGTELKVFMDRLMLYVFLGILLGARGFHIIFYEGKEYLFEEPLGLFKVWEGGLASHGGVIGMFISLLIFRMRYSILSWFYLMDMGCVVAGVAGCCIRLGNFFNQEILGIPTDLPFGVLFGHPIDGGLPLPRHPVQLYEAFIYLLLFAFFWLLRKRYGMTWREGTMSGLFLLIAALFRFLIEFFKEEQSAWLLYSQLNMGQWLTLPFILIGAFLILRKDRFGYVK